MSSKIVNHSDDNTVSELAILLESCSQDQLLAIIAEMIESEPIDYQEMSKEEMIAFITENYNYALNA